MANGNKAANAKRNVSISARNPISGGPINNPPYPSVATLGYGGLLIGPPLIGFLAEMLTLRLAFTALLPLAVAIILLSGALRPVDPN